MSLAIRVPTKTQTASPYVAGKPIDELAREYGLDPSTIVKLASNENPLGMSPKAMQAMSQIDAQRGARYPDANGFALKGTIGGFHDVDPSCVVIGNGSENIIEIVAKAFVEPGVSCVSSQYAFVVFAQSVHNQGGTNIIVPAKNLECDLDAMRNAITPETAVVYIANPNNPTGTFIEPKAMAAFLEQVPSSVLVLLDEAYNEYLPADLRFDGAQYTRQFPNVIVTRTFSKVYGMASLRVGYSISSPEVAEYMNRVRTVFNVSEYGQVAAVAALGDHEFLARSYEANRSELLRVQDAFAARGLSFVESVANFVLVNVGDAAAVNQSLLRQAVIVRPMGMYGLGEWLRISIGNPEENTRMLAALDIALAANS